MVRQQSSLIITLEWELVPSQIGLENRYFSFSVSLSTRCNKKKSQALNRKNIETIWSFLSEMLML